MYSNAHESNTTEEFAIMVANLNREHSGGGGVGG